MDQRSGSPGGRRAVLETAMLACEMAASDFPAAVRMFRAAATKAGAHRLAECARDLCTTSMFSECACLLYIIADATSREIAANIGRHLITAGNGVDALVIAVSDITDTSTDPLAAVSLMEEYYLRCESTEYISKLVDHYRDAGQSFMAERLLRRKMEDGVDYFGVRLAEHWVEFQEWFEAFQALRALPAEYTSAETIYLLGRSAAALFMEPHLQVALRRLRHLGGLGLTYAELLSAVWEWRLGNEGTALALCPKERLATPLIERDRLALCACHRSVDVTAQSPPLRIGSKVFQGSPDLPNVLMIGMQRTATSWFWQVFGAHKDVQPMTFKETTFFNEHFRGLDLYPLEARGLDVGESALRYWEGPTRSIKRFRDLYHDQLPVRMDVSPSYAELPPATVASVRDILGSDTKIIVCLRDPIERTWSNLKLDQKLVGRRALDLSFDQRKAFYDSAASRRRGDYVKAYHTWRRRFRNIHVIAFDDIVHDPGRVIIDTCQFIGLDPAGISDFIEPAYMSDDTYMPIEDRAYLLESFENTYRGCEDVIGAQASLWRRRQIELLSVASAAHRQRCHLRDGALAS